MTNDDDELRKKVALFRYGLIADLLHLHGPRCGVYAELDKKAERSYAIPGSTRTQVAAETIRGWLKDYRQGGFDALLPQRRSDAGASRRLPQSVQDILLTIKEEHEDYTVNLVIQEAQKHPQMPADLVLAPSTVHRLLSRHGLMKKPTATGSKDRPRFEFAHAGDLWMSDVMHGPAVVVEGKRKRKTYLIAFIELPSVVAVTSSPRSRPRAWFPPEAHINTGRLCSAGSGATRSPTSSLVCSPPNPSHPSVLASVPLARTYLDADALLGPIHGHATPPPAEAPRSESGHRCSAPPDSLRGGVRVSQVTRSSSSYVPWSYTPPCSKPTLPLTVSPILPSRNTALSAQGIT